MQLLESVYHFFDKFEDHVRAVLSTHKFIYTFVGGIGVVLFWRGVWYAADLLESTTVTGSILFSPFGSIIFSVIILLATGLFVSMFIGDSIIMSGIKNEKKDIDKTRDEMESEKSDIDKVLSRISEVKKEIEVLEAKVRS